MSRVLIAAATLLALSASTALAPAPSEGRIRGASLGLFAVDRDYDYGVMVREIASRGATDLLVVVEWTQAHRLSHDPGPGARTASTRALRRTIRQARADGLRVGVMPILRLPDTAPGRWRGTLDPVDPAAWMRAYGDHLVALAALAEAEGVVRLVAGSELVSMQRHEARWLDLVERVRAAFHGEVAYAANWDALEVPFAHALDSLGVSAYFPLAAEGERAGLSVMTRRWERPLRRLDRLRRDTGLPVFLAEVGYPAHPEAASAPWRPSAAGPADVELQADLFRAFCAAAAEDRRVAGYYVWNWFGWGGPNDPGYSPRGKPAAAVLETCMRRAA